MKVSNAFNNKNVTFNNNDLDQITRKINRNFKTLTLLTDNSESYFEAFLAVLSTMLETQFNTNTPYRLYDLILKTYKIPIEDKDELKKKENINKTIVFNYYIFSNNI